MAIQKILKVGTSQPFEEFSPIDTSTGAGDAGKPIAADSTGKLDSSFLPSGVGADTQVVQASEALNAGHFVNIYDGGAGVFRCRKADASTSGKEANGFVLAAVSSGSNATVYQVGSANNQLSGLTPSKYYLSTTTAGGVQTTIPTGSGQVVQELGVASSATTLVFTPKAAILRA